jgi:hypothetical protein
MLEGQLPAVPFDLIFLTTPVRRGCSDVRIHRLRTPIEGSRTDLIDGTSEEFHTAGIA